MASVSYGKLLDSGVNIMNEPFVRFFVIACVAVFAGGCGSDQGSAADSGEDRQPDPVVEHIDLVEAPDLRDVVSEPGDILDIEMDDIAGGEGDPADAPGDPAGEDPSEEEATCRVPDGPPYSVRVSRVIGSTGVTEIIDEYADTPFSLRPLNMERTTGGCTRWMPDSAVVTPVVEDPSCGHFEYEVANLGYDHENDLEKACIIILEGDQDRCAGTADEYGAGIWVTKWNLRWAEDWCADHTCSRDWARTMKIEVWHDVNGNCTWEGSENLEGYTDDIFEWDAGETYRIIIEYN